MKKNLYYFAEYVEENVVKDEKLLYELKLILPTEQEVWTGLDFSEMSPSEVNEMKLEYIEFLTRLENMLISDYRVFDLYNFDIIFKQNFYIPHWQVSEPLASIGDPRWGQEIYELEDKRKDFFSNQKINFKRDKNIFYISWLYTDEIVEVKLNHDNLTAMIQYFIHDWLSG
jgi:hypothetical protein